MTNWINWTCDDSLTCLARLLPRSCRQRPCWWPARRPRAGRWLSEKVSHFSTIWTLSIGFTFESMGFTFDYFRPKRLWKRQALQQTVLAVTCATVSRHLRHYLLGHGWKSARALRTNHVFQRFDVHPQQIVTGGHESQPMTDFIMGVSQPTVNSLWWRNYKHLSDDAVLVVAHDDPARGEGQGGEEGEGQLDGHHRVQYVVQACWVGGSLLTLSKLLVNALCYLQHATAL